MWDNLKVTLDQHRRYLEVSGDLSPIHESETYARQFGLEQRVVHGTHLLEIVLNYVFIAGVQISWERIDVEMLKPVFPEEEFELHKIAYKDMIQIKLMRDSVLKLRVTIALENTQDKRPSTTGIQSNQVKMLVNSLREVSRFMGMTYPASKGILRRLQISKKVIGPSSEDIPGIFTKVFSFEEFSITATSLINRHVSEDYSTMLIPKTGRLDSLINLFTDSKILIVGYGTLGKLLTRILEDVRHKEIDILIKPTARREDIGSEGLLGPRFLTDILDLRASYDYVFFVASPIIVLETELNRSDQELLYRRTFLELLHHVLHKVSDVKGFFYPSSHYLNTNPPKNLEIYCKVKRESEILLQNHFASKPLVLSLSRLRPFSSRHHSPILKSSDEISRGELVEELLNAMSHWLPDVNVKI